MPFKMLQKGVDFFILCIFFHLIYCSLGLSFQLFQPKHLSESQHVENEVAYALGPWGAALGGHSEVTADAGCFRLDFSAFAPQVF